eukprot:gnl/MRDRNA2_/MRDRNA2_109294_c0_seq1.p1 gnl/MRDRNA2_/MRDRNA2_109294_c0~~gnl/MRDRNA2_/MRDRNA2_109294_c0_seq1.p1  ORF type:complete len:197 (-),score=37.63 gnl/MRDRNA2_/MRDRNA2_109294_c0_seq1:113-703(-)
MSAASGKKARKKLNEVLEHAFTRQCGPAFLMYARCMNSNKICPREPLRNEAESKFCIPEFEDMTHCVIFKCFQGGSSGSSSVTVDDIRALEKASIACGNAKSLFTDNMNLYWQEQLEYNERPEVKAGGKGAMNEVAKNYKSTLTCWQRFDEYSESSANDYKSLWRRCLWELYKQPLTNVLLKAKNCRAGEMLVSED